MKKKLLRLALSLLLCLSLLPLSVLAGEQSPADEIVIFYTNDIHTYIDNAQDKGLTYSM